MAISGNEALQSLLEALHPVVISPSPEAEIWHTPLLEMEAVALALAILQFLAKHQKDALKMRSAILLAADLHQPDLRYGEAETTRPYIVHPLRNTLRLIRLGATDVSLLIASVLHDTVEDHPHELAKLQGQIIQDESEARAAGFSYIAEHYGERTAEIVKGMSNPLSVDRAPSIEEKRRLYAEHVEQAIVDPFVFICKCSDFIDNAVGIVYAFHRPGQTSRGKYGAKYLPVFSIMQKRLQLGREASDLPISQEGIIAIQRELDIGYDGLRQIWEE